jgi:hypothetical protein
MKDSLPATRSGRIGEGLGKFCVTMAVVPPTDGQMRAYVMEHTDADLVYVFEDIQLPLKIQYKIVEVGFRTLRAFSGLEESRQEVRKLATTLFLVDAIPENIFTISQICAAWETSREFVTKDTALRAEAKVLGQSRPLGTTEKTAMKRMLELKWGKVAKAETPSPAYLAEKLEECEQDEPQAAALDEISSVEDKEVPIISSDVNLMGAIIVTKKRGRHSLPTDPETYRAKMKIEANVWLMLAQKFPNRPWMTDLSPVHFLTFVDYILSKKVNGLEVNGVLVSPAWTITLGYELACRQKAFELVREDGHTLKSALVAVTRDTELKELYFTTPIAIGSRSGATSSTSGIPAIPNVPNPAGNRKKRKLELYLAKQAATAAAKGTKGGKGKGKGKGKEDKSNLASSTPDGRQICFAYNAGGCAGSCGRVHVCRIKGCFKDHTMAEHAGA